MRYAKLIGTVSLAALFVVEPGSAQAPPMLEANLGDVVRALVVDSLNGGGRHHAQVLVAADSASGAVMQEAAITVASAIGVACPRSDPQGPGVAPIGYQVAIAIRGEGDRREVSVRKSCMMTVDGRQRGFSHTGVFEVLRERGVWRVARVVQMSMP